MKIGNLECPFKLDDYVCVANDIPEEAIDKFDAGGETARIYGIEFFREKRGGEDELQIVLEFSDRDIANVPAAGFKYLTQVNPPVPD